MAPPAGEQRRTNPPPKVKETLFSPLLVLMMLIYPTLLAFVFAARLAMFAVVIPIPTPNPAVPGGAPPSDADGSLHRQNPWKTAAGAGAVIRTTFGFVSISVVYFVIFSQLLRLRGSYGGPHICAASMALWFTTTCFFLTYTSMARYGAPTWEWWFAVVFSFIILCFTLDFLGTSLRPDDKVVVHDPAATAVV